MPDHVHLFVALPVGGPITLSKWMQSLRSVLGKELLRLGYKSRPGRMAFSITCCGAAESYSQKWEYVRMNPVRAGFVSRARGLGISGRDRECIRY